MAISVGRYQPPYSKQTSNENYQRAPLPSNKSIQPPNSHPKRALGDITNSKSFHDNRQKHVLKAPFATKIHRTAITSTKNNSTNSAAALRAKAAKAFMPAQNSSTFPIYPSALGAQSTSGKLENSTTTSMTKTAKVPLPLGFSRLAIAETNSVDGTAKLETLMIQCPNNIVDIDQPDMENELANALYAKDVHANYFNVESKFMTSPEYMEAQTDINIKMRAILVDWLIDVHLKFKLQPETLHLTINIIDRFIDSKNVTRHKLQLVGITAMLIASKYQEIYAPEASDFVYISDRAYPKEEIIAMEAIILKKLNFELTTPSVLTILHRCIKAAKVESTYDINTHMHTALYLVELGLQSSEMLRFLPSVRAAAACHLAAELRTFSLTWTPAMSFYSGGWEENDLEECKQHYIKILKHERASTNNKLTAVKRKFGASAYSLASQYICK